MSRVERKQQAADEKQRKKDKKTMSRKEKFEARQAEALVSDVPENKEPAEKKEKAKRLARFKNWFKNLKTWKKVLLIAGISILILAIIGGTIAYCYFNSIFGEIYEPTPEDYDLSLVDVDGYYNILLLGVDSRNMDNIKGTRSDAIMMISINKDTNDVKVLSVYRDTYMQMGDSGSYDKITHACARGGPEMTMKSLNQAMDLNISNYVVVNFKAVADLVDAVGGIEVDVQDYEINQLNKYTKETADNIGRKEYNLVKAPGVQTLEGVQAVSYGRIRKGVGDDFKRTERMRTVIELVMEKMKGMSFKDMKDIIKMMTPQVKTNLSKNDILALAIRLPQYNITETTGWPYNVSTGLLNKVSYVFPSNLQENVIKLHREFFERPDYSPSATVSRISAEIASRIQAARDSNQIKDEQTEVKPNTPPDEPVAPEKPENPGEPEKPEGPGETTDPENPGGGETEGPTEPVDPPAGGGGTEPDPPTEPENPGGSGETTEPEKPPVDKPDESVKPAA